MLRTGINQLRNNVFHKPYISKHNTPARINLKRIFSGQTMPLKSSLKNVVLYHYPMTRSARVLWTLHELEIPVQVKRVDVINGEAQTKEFLEKNTNHAGTIYQSTI